MEIRDVRSLCTSLLLLLQLQRLLQSVQSLLLMLQLQLPLLLLRHP